MTALQITLVCQLHQGRLLTSVFSAAGMEKPDLWPKQPITWISVKDISVSLKFLSLDL